MTLDEEWFPQAEHQEHGDKRKKIDKLHFINVTNSCASKDALKVKRQLLKRDKTLANHMSDKGLVSRIYEELASQP